MNIVITGSSTGIGRALAERLLAKGHRIWGLARSPQDDLASKHPGSFGFSRCDVSDWTRVETTAREILTAWPHVDGLVCCAGIQGEIGRAVTADPLRWSATARTNLDGTFFAIRALNGALRSGPRRAKIVCFSGGGSTKARPNFSAYGVAKTAIVRLVETIAEEEKDSPLDINAIAPGGINTRLTDEIVTLGSAVVGEAEYQSALKQKASGGASIDRALDCIEWMLSPESDGISGRLISAPWDPWNDLSAKAASLAKSDIYTLRRIVPADRSQQW
ncbi:MAG: SDR family oxidoreductase [Opitutaceae bacterium]|jgi:NAD(P)-dependent dehydrogenase (short-subunit alcohol dehydrogenase family)